LIHLNMAVIANYQASKIAQPSKSAFNFPSFPVSSKLSAVLRFIFRTIAPMRNNKICFQLFTTLTMKGAAISIVVDKSFGSFFGPLRPQRGTVTASSVFSASFTSAGDAEARRLPRGTPWPSTTTIHFVPLPFLALAAVVSIVSIVHHL
jgi:hypothetical protein